MSKRRKKRSRNRADAEMTKFGYVYRDRVLPKLGYEDYRAYLDSDLWKTIRSKKISLDSKCEVCELAATEVHHFCYHESVLSGVQTIPLVSVCRGCHEEIEFDGLKKLKTRDAQLKMLRLLHSAGRAARARALSVILKSLKPSHEGEGSKWYVVLNCKKAGVYRRWADVQRIVKGRSRAYCRAFASQQEAIQAMSSSTLPGTKAVIAKLHKPKHKVKQKRVQLSQVSRKPLRWPREVHIDLAVKTSRPTVAIPLVSPPVNGWREYAL